MSILLRRSLFPAALVLLLLALTACSSIPKVANDSHSILIVIIESHNPKNIHSGIEEHYEFRVPGNDEMLYIKPILPYAMGVNMKAGTYDYATIVTRVVATQGGGWSSGAEDNAMYNIKATYQLKGGYINFFPVKFVHSIESKAGGVNSGWNLVPTTNADKERVLVQLRKDENFNLWKTEF